MDPIRPFSEFVAEPDFINAPVSGRVAMLNRYYDNAVAARREQGGPTLDQDVSAIFDNKRRALVNYGLSRLPGDIPVAENVTNAATKTFARMWQGNIGYGLLGSGDLDRYHAFLSNLEKTYPTRDTLSATVGEAAGSIIPTAAALAATYASGGAAAPTLLAALTTSAAHAGSAMGGSLLDIKEQERLTGQEIGPGTTAAVMAGNAIMELIPEFGSIYAIRGLARAFAKPLAIGQTAVAKLGTAAMKGDPAGVTSAVVETLKRPGFRRSVAVASGWAGISGTEAAEEAFTQVGQNIVDKLYKPVNAFEGVGEAALGGAIGGGLLGPFSLALQTAQYDRIIDAYKTDEQQKFSALQGVRPETRGYQYDANAWDNPSFRFAREFSAKAGMTLVPVRGAGFRGELITPLPDSHIALVDTEQAERDWGTLGPAMVAAHEFTHWLRRKAPAVFEGLWEDLRANPDADFEAYRARTADLTRPERERRARGLVGGQVGPLTAPDALAVRQAVQATETDPAYAREEVLADWAAVNFFSASFQGRLTKALSASKDGRAVAKRLRDRLFDLAFTAEDALAGARAMGGFEGTLLSLSEAIMADAKRAKLAGDALVDMVNFATTGIENQQAVLRNIETLTRAAAQPEKEEEVPDVQEMPTPAPTVVPSPAPPPQNVSAGQADPSILGGMAAGPQPGVESLTPPGGGEGVSEVVSQEPPADATQPVLPSTDAIQSTPQAISGLRARVYFPVSQGDYMDAVLRFVPMGQVRSSLDAGYPAWLQPRTKAAKSTDIKAGEVLSRGVEIERLLAPSATTTDGPVMAVRLGEDDMLDSVSGTARLRVIQRARLEKPEVWAQMQAYTRALAARYGISLPENHDMIPVWELQAHQFLDQKTRGMTREELIRNPDALAELAARANLPAARPQSRGEFAQANASLLDPAILSLISTGEDGRFDVASNDAFMRAFVAATRIPNPTQAGGFTDAAYEQARDAVLAYTLANAAVPPQVIDGVIEVNRTLGMTSVVEGIAGAIGPLQRLAGTPYAITLDLGRVAARIFDWKMRQKRDPEYRDSFSVFVAEDQEPGLNGFENGFRLGPVERALASALVDAASAKQVRDFLLDYAKRARSAPADLFGAGQTREQLLGVQSPAERPRDAEYMAAVEAGDMEKAQRMVDEAAKAAGAKMRVWRGESGGARPNIYPRAYRREPGIFTTENRKIAEDYGYRGEARPFFVFGKVMDLTGGPDEYDAEAARWVQQWVKDEEHFDWIDRESGEEVSPESVVFSGHLHNYEGLGSGARWKDLQVYARNSGLDAVLLADMHPNVGRFVSVVVLRETMIKSADPVTRDDAGDVIPLSQRFQSVSPDIRFSPAEGAAAPAEPGVWLDASGDVVAGDTIRFKEAVFGGSFKKPTFLGEREVVAEVLRDSYGAEKQQHTFSIRVVSSSGTQPLEPGFSTRRKGRNVYRNGTERLKWQDESARVAVADEKHARGADARAQRAFRQSFSPAERSFHYQEQAGRHMVVERGPNGRRVYEYPTQEEAMDAVARQTPPDPRESTVAQVLSNIQITQNMISAGWVWDEKKKRWTASFKKPGQLSPAEFVIAERGTDPGAAPSPGAVYVVSRLATGLDVAEVAANIEGKLSPGEEPAITAVYREVSPDAALEMSPWVSADFPFGAPETFFATTEMLALGQGLNKGVLLEFDRAFPLRAPRGVKPGAEIAAEHGAGEELVARIQPSELRRHLRAVTLKPNTMGTKGEVRRMKQWMSSLETEGWVRSEGADGSITVRRPALDFAQSPAENRPREHEVKKNAGLHRTIPYGDETLPVHHGAFSSSEEALRYLMAKHAFDPAKGLSSFPLMEADADAMPTPSDKHYAYAGLRDIAWANKGEVRFMDTMVVRNPEWIEPAARLNRKASDLTSNIGVALNAQKSEYDPLSEAYALVMKMSNSVVLTAPVADLAAKQDAIHVVIRAAQEVAAETVPELADTVLAGQSPDYYLDLAMEAAERELQRDLSALLGQIPEGLPPGLQSPAETFARLMSAANRPILLERLNADEDAFGKQFLDLGWTEAMVATLKAALRKYEATVARIQGARKQIHSPVAAELNKASKKERKRIKDQAEKELARIKAEIRRIAGREVAAAVQEVSTTLRQPRGAENDVVLALRNPAEYEAALLEAYNRALERLQKARETVGPEGVTSPEIADLTAALADVGGDLDALQAYGYPRAALRRFIREARSRDVDALLARFPEDLRDRLRPAIKAELANLPERVTAVPRADPDDPFDNTVAILAALAGRTDANSVRAREELTKYHARRAAIMRALRREMKALETDIGKILHSGIAFQEAAKTRVVESIVARLGLTGAEAEMARAGIARVLEEEVAKKAAAELKALQARAKPAERGKRKQMHDQLVKLAAVGALDPAAGNSVLARALGLDMLPEGADAEIARLLGLLEQAYYGFGPHAVETAVRFSDLKAYITKQLTARKPAHKRWLDRALAIFYPSILAGPDTQLTNIIGNLWKGGMTAFENSLLDLMTGRMSASDAGWTYAQALALLPEAARTEALSVLEQGTSLARTEGKFKDRAYRYGAEQLPGWLSWLKFIGRGMAAGDAAFFHAAKELTLLQETLAGFLAEGMDSDAARAKTLEVLGYSEMARFEAEAREQWATKLGVPNPTPVQVRTRALELRDDFRRQHEVDLGIGFERGREVTFTPETIKSPLLRVVLQALNTIKDRLPATNFVVPFTNIAAAIIDSALDYFPLSSVWRATDARKAYALAETRGEGQVKARRDFHMATLRAVEGFALLTAVMLAMAAEAEKEPEDRVFEIWGPGPKDFKKNAQWRATGARAYHGRIGGMTFDYRVSPAFLVLGLFGSVMDAMRYETDPEDVNMQVVAMTTLFAGISLPAEQSFLRGVKDLLDLGMERDPAQRTHKAKDVIASITTNLIPGANFFRQMHKMVDPTLRQTDGSLLGTVLAQTPIASGILPERVNLLGSPLLGDRPVLDRLAILGGPDAVEDPDDLAILRELVRQRIWLSVPSPLRTSLINKQDLRPGEYRRMSPELSGKDMSVEQYLQFMQERGARFKARALPRLEAWATAKDRDAVQAEVRKMLDRATTEARRVVLGLNPRR